VLLWWALALAVALWQRDSTTLLCGMIIGGGFGFGFAVSAAWCHGYTYAPAWIDWWKMWELHAGFILGALYALVLFWELRRVDKAHLCNGMPVMGADVAAAVPERWKTLFAAVAGFVLVFGAGVEYFFRTGLTVALFYFLAVALITCAKPAHAQELRRYVLLCYSLFLLMFILLHGVTSRLGVFLELYAPDAVDQYAWPKARIALFLPAAFILFLVTLRSIMRQYCTPTGGHAKSLLTAERLIDLCAFIALVGAISIWPSKIAVMYSIYLMLALYALARISKWYGHIEATAPLQSRQ